MVYILKDPDYYGKTPQKASQIAANSQTYAMAVSIPVILVSGFLFDLIGRGKTTSGTFIVGSIATMMIPLVSPSIALYDLFRVILINSLVVMLANPFINDYV